MDTIGKGCMLITFIKERLHVYHFYKREVTCLLLLGVKGLKDILILQVRIKILFSVRTFTNIQLIRKYNAQNQYLTSYFKHRLKYLPQTLSQLEKRKRDL